jgi:Tol biopolymer transport system component
LTRVADDPEPEQCPLWSPSGQQVIFAGEDKTSVPEGEDGFRLMSIRPDGSNSLFLGWVFPGGSGQLFRFSPDGRQLAAVFYNDLARLSVNLDGLFALSEPDQGMEPWQYLNWNQAGASAPAWSPDSRRLAFPCADNIRDNTKICIINADGTSGFALTDASFGGSKPAWSPDGLKIAFVDYSYPTGIYVMNTDGSGLLRLAADLGLTGGDWDPEAFFWSPRALAP